MGRSSFHLRPRRVGWPRRGRACITQIPFIAVAEAEGGVVTPMDCKCGKRQLVVRGIYDPERVQVCLQALLVEEHGYRVDEGAIR